MSKRYRDYKISEAWLNYVFNIRGRHKKIFSFHKFREVRHYAEKKVKKIQKEWLNRNSLSPHKKRRNNEGI